MLPLIELASLIYNFSIRQSEFVVVNITTQIITDNYHQKGIEKYCFPLLCFMVLTFVNSLYFLEYVFLVILNSGSDRFDELKFTPVSIFNYPLL